MIDEAGMLSSRKFKALLDEAKKHNAKCVFVGDTKQFKPIEQGKMFYDLFKKSSITKTEITKILRQKEGYLKSVVKDLSDRNRSKDSIESAFNTLSNNDRIKTVEKRKVRLNQVSNEYLSDRQTGIESFVLSATNSDKDEVNTIVRNVLVDNNEVEHGTSYTTFQSANLSGIHQRISDNYKEQQVVFFQNKVGDVKKGTQAEIVGRDSDTNSITVQFWNKKKRAYETSKIEIFQHGSKMRLFNVRAVHFGAGDRVIFLKNDKRIGVNNGNIGTIKSIDYAGNATVVLTNKDKKGNYKTVTFNLNNRGEKGFNFLDLAYSITNYKSQGATLDKIIINHSSDYLTYYNSWYVTITRAKHDVTIYTDDKKVMIDQAKEEQKKGSTIDFTVPKKKDNDTYRKIIDKSELAKNIVLDFEQPVKCSDIERSRVLNKKITVKNIEKKKYHGVDIDF